MRALRAERVGDQMKRELSELLRTEIQDPRVPPFTGVSQVEVTSDLGHATCHVSVLGSKEEQEACLQALRKAAGFLRREIAGRMRLRVSPELHFKLDDSVREGLRMSKLIDETLAADARIREAHRPAEETEADRPEDEE